MRRLIALLLGLVILSAISTPPLYSQARGDLSAADLYKKVAPSVVLIEMFADDGSPYKTGSGCIVGSNGEILTNYHVISHSKKIRVTFNGELQANSATVVGIDKQRDLAILRVRSVALPGIEIGDSKGLLVGDKVFALGSPLGLKNSFSDGIVSGFRNTEGGSYLQISAPISHGSSGGAIVNSQGKLIGIAVATIEEGQNLNFAIPIEDAAGLLRSTTETSLESIYEPEESLPSNPLAVQSQLPRYWVDATSGDSSYEIISDTGYLNMRSTYVLGNGANGGFVCDTVRNGATWKGPCTITVRVATQFGILSCSFNADLELLKVSATRIEGSLRAKEDHMRGVNAGVPQNTCSAIPVHREGSAIAIVPR